MWNSLILNFRFSFLFFFSKVSINNLSGAFSDHGAISFQTPRQWMPKDYVCANKGPLQRAGTAQSSAVNLLQKIPRLQDSLTSFSMTSVASQTHPSQPFCYPGSPPCHTLGLLGSLGCRWSITSHLPSGCGSDTVGSLPFPDLRFLSCLPHVLEALAIALMFSV